jgi:hypothetical protein
VDAERGDIVAPNEENSLASGQFSLQSGEQHFSDAKTPFAAIDANRAIQISCGIAPVGLQHFGDDRWLLRRMYRRA